MVGLSWARFLRTRDIREYFNLYERNRRRKVSSLVYDRYFRHVGYFILNLFNRVHDSPVEMGLVLFLYFSAVLARDIPALAFLGALAFSTFYQEYP